MAWLLDTCVVSDSIKSLPNATVRQWLHAHRGQCLMPAVSVGEILYGIERMVPSARRSRLQLWFEQLCHGFEGKILPTDEIVWRTWSHLRVSCQAMGRPQADLDLLIAATAVAHRLPLVTRNIRHFQDTGLVLVNPWEPGSAD